MARSTTGGSLPGRRSHLRFCRRRSHRRVLGGPEGSRARAATAQGVRGRGRRRGCTAPWGCAASMLARACPWCSRGRRGWRRVGCGPPRRRRPRGSGRRGGWEGGKKVGGGRERGMSSSVQLSVSECGTFVFHAKHARRAGEMQLQEGARGGHSRCLEGSSRRERRSRGAGLQELNVRAGPEACLRGQWRGATPRRLSAAGLRQRERAHRHGRPGAGGAAGTRREQRTAPQPRHPKGRGGRRRQHGRWQED